MIAFVPFTYGILENQTLEAKASRLGLVIGTAGVVSKSNWNNDLGVVGNTYPVKDTLKANGARWNGLAKAWTFASMEALEIAINAIEEAK
jgi:hypothetical protein